MTPSTSTLTPIKTGHVWSDFLLARKRVIEWMISDNQTLQQIAQSLSMDEMQVRLIHMTDENEIG